MANLYDYKRMLTQGQIFFADGRALGGEDHVPAGIA